EMGEGAAVGRARERAGALPGAVADAAGRQRDERLVAAVRAGHRRRAREAGTAPAGRSGEREQKCSERESRRHEEPAHPPGWIPPSGEFETDQRWSTTRSALPSLRGSDP